jgi:hypothetical protein
LLDFGDMNEGDLDDNSTSRLLSNSITTEDKDAEIRTLKKEYKILLTMYR